MSIKPVILGVFTSLITPYGLAESANTWLLIDNFEQPKAIEKWLKMDPDNNTKPFVDSPQITETHLETTSDNHFLLKKPAAEGIIGNRKAISIKRLPTPVPVGETYTFYTRIKVEYFPNNHSFGLSNLSAQEIEKQNYNSFEPMIRVTDKFESNSYKNDGTLMVMVDDKKYQKIRHLGSGEDARPLSTKHWYELWYVINNATHQQGGQSYDIYRMGFIIVKISSGSLCFEVCSDTKQNILFLAHERQTILLVTEAYGLYVR